MLARSVLPTQIEKRRKRRNTRAKVKNSQTTRDDRALLAQYSTDHSAHWGYGLGAVIT